MARLLSGAGVPLRAKSIMPVRLLIERHGPNQPFAEIIPRFQCSKCGKAPAPVYLVAGFTRQFCGRGLPKLAVEVVPAPR